MRIEVKFNFTFKTSKLLSVFDYLQILFRRVNKNVAKESADNWLDKLVVIENIIDEFIALACDVTRHDNKALFC